MEFIAQHSGEITSVFFFFQHVFVIIVRSGHISPRNKNKLQEFYANIPLKGEEHGGQ